MGLESPEVVSKRLDEIFGNRQMSILTAIRRLRNFKASKSSPAEQLIDLVTAVQRCRTVLEGIDALEVALGDMETVASIVYNLPIHARERWYQQRGPANEAPVQKGRRLLEWLEYERESAVNVHIDEMARRMQVSGTQSSQASKPSHSDTSTDQGLYTTGVTPVGPGSSQGLTTTPNTPLPLGPGGQSDGRTHLAGGQDIPTGPITTATMADEVTSCREANLTTKKLDVCPLCKVRHHFDKKWPKVTPEKTTRMISTHLSTCPKFVNLSAAQREATVTAQGA